jgi:hypothetical protein
MAKNKVSEWSSTPANNTDVGGIDINEGCAPSGINNAIRDIMAQIKDMQTGADGDNFVVGGNLSVTGTTTLTGTTTINGTLNLSSDLPITDGGTGASTASGARTNLGLGSIATQDSTAVAITGGSITGITDLLVADGGTGASSITANSVILGNGTSALNGNLVAPGTSGNVLTSNGTTWTSAALSFDKSLTSTGYQQLPGGLIIQWGSGTINGSAVNFSTAFPNAVFSATVSPTGAASVDNVTISTLSTTQIRATQVSGGSSNSYYFIAIGY